MVGPKEAKEEPRKEQGRSVIPLLSLTFVVLVGGVALWTQPGVRDDVARGVGEVEIYAGEAEKETSHLSLG